MEPTLCFSLKTGLRIAAILDIIISLVMLVASGLGIYYFEKHKEQVLDFFANQPQELNQYVELHHLGEISVLVFLSFSCVYWIQKVWLGCTMYRAACTGDQDKLRVWIIYTFVLLTLSIAFFLASICMQVVQLMAIPVYVVVFIVREYSIWILVRYKLKLEDSKSPLLVNANEFTNL